MDFTAKGRVQAVRELLPRARTAGVTKLIVDTCVLDLATLGQACSAMHDIKNEFGLPVGGGVHNAVAVWKGLKKKMGDQAVKPCVAAVCASSVAMGADFILYGPVEDAPYVFPAVAMIDTALSQLVMERGEQPRPEPPAVPRRLIPTSFDNACGILIRPDPRLSVAIRSTRDPVPPFAGSSSPDPAYPILSYPARISVPLPLLPLRRPLYFVARAILSAMAIDLRPSRP